MRRSAVPVAAVLGNALRVVRHPRFAARLAAFELDRRLFDWRHERASGLGHAIRQVGFRITDACQLRCHTCGQWGDHGYLHGESLRALRARELPAARYRELLDDLAAHGHRPILYFWGGEPMLYPGLLDLVQHGARLGMPPTIATNGTGVARASEQLIDAPALLVQVSIDGATAATHDAARPGVGGQGGSFETAAGALEHLHTLRRERRAALPLIVSLTTISRRNQHELCAIYERFADVTDLQIYYLSWWIDAEAAGAHEAELARRFGATARRPASWLGDWRVTDTEALAETLAALRTRAAGGTPVYVVPSLTTAADLGRYYTDHAATFGFDACTAIFQTPEVDSNGDLSPCRDYGDFVVGNVREHTITALWNSERYVRFRQGIAREGLLPVCTRCCGLMGH